MGKSLNSTVNPRTSPYWPSLKHVVLLLFLFSLIFKLPDFEIRIANIYMNHVFIKFIPTNMSAVLS